MRLGARSRLLIQREQPKLNIPTSLSVTPRFPVARPARINIPAAKMTVRAYISIAPDTTIRNLGASYPKIRLDSEAEVTSTRMAMAILSTITIRPGCAKTRVAQERDTVPKLTFRSPAHGWCIQLRFHLAVTIGALN